MIKFDEILRRFLYVSIVRMAQRATGVKPYFKAQYALYLQGPRWYILRHLRYAWDGGCVVCHTWRGIEAHHTTYDHKDRGWGIMEFLSLRTLCRAHHAAAHGKG